MKPFFYTPLAVAGVFMLLFAVERFFPLRESRAGLIARLIVNASLSAVTFLVAVNGCSALGVADVELGVSPAVRSDSCRPASSLGAVCCRVFAPGRELSLLAHSCHFANYLAELFARYLAQLAYSPRSA
jgi:hypothetical protein